MASGKGLLWIVIFLAAGSVFSGTAWSQTRGASGVPLATQDRLKEPGWWPTKGTAIRREYVGPAMCAECHSFRAKTQQNTPMALAAAPTAAAEILRRYPSLVFRSGSYKFEIITMADKNTYSVSDGVNLLTQSLDWVFGAGEVGQTYVFQRNGNFYESRVSFYPGIQALDLTLGHHAPIENDLTGALGRIMPASEVKLCFGCHTTASSTVGRFDVAGLIAGVTCEACHGPGARHVDAMRQKQRQLQPQTILNPARLNPVDSVDFCGACHRTTWDVALANTVGIANVRFQPYRLEKSRCWGKGDARLTCMACHDPHVPLIQDSAAYDSRCLSCHVSSSSEKISDHHPGKGCPVGANKCVTCHMAKYEIPGAHAKFTDHWIRVVKTGAPYTD